MKNKWKKKISLFLLLSAGLLGLRDVYAAGNAADGILLLSADARQQESETEAGREEKEEQTEGKEAEKEEETESGGPKKEETESGDSQRSDPAESGDAKIEESGDAEEKPGEGEEEKKEETEKEKEEEKGEEKEKEEKPEEKETEKENKKPERIEPQLEIHFDGPEAEKEGYYRQQRRARISLKGEQLALEELHVLLSGREVEDLLWTREGEQWQTSLVFSEDGDYLLELYLQDQAGNKSCLLSESFVIDSLCPRIDISGVEDKSANRGEICPVIEIQDAHIDVKESSITLTGANQGLLSLGQTVSEEGDSVRIALSDIPQEKSYDDLYTLRICGRDLAGNQTEKEISFSVNRYGSVYTIEGNPQEWMNRYNQEVPEIIVHEYNVDWLNEGERELVLTENGLVCEAEEGKDYQLSSFGTEGSRKEYIYSLAKECFAQDGSYRLAFYSQDRAGNINQSAKQLEIGFGIDREKPKISAINLEEKGSYETEGESYEGAFSVSDNIGLEEVSFLLDGSPVEAKEEKGVWSLALPAGEKAHKVQVIAKDQAGNRAEYRLEGLRVLKEEKKGGLKGLLEQIFGGEKQEEGQISESGDSSGSRVAAGEAPWICGLGCGIGLLLILLLRKFRRSA